MTATVEVFGDILRDSTNESKRNYVNLQIVVKDDGRFVMAYHLTNYAPNAATLLHRLTIKSYTSLTECDRAYIEKRMAKLGKDRAVFKTVSKKYEGTEESLKEMSDMLSDIHFKVEIKKARAFCKGIMSRIEASKPKPTPAPEPVAAYIHPEDDDESLFDELDHEDTEASTPSMTEDDLVERERASSLGKSTSAKNAGWGLF